MNWRQWTYEKLIADGTFTALIPAASVLGAGSVDMIPDTKPFAVIKMDVRIPAIKEGVAHKQTLRLWLHDEPGSYVVLDQAVQAARAALSGYVAQSGAVRCEHRDVSPDLADDVLGTIVKYVTFDLVGTGA